MNSDFETIVERAVEAGVKKALNVSEATNRRLLTMVEAAGYLSLSVSELFNITASGGLRKVQHGKRVMIDIQDLDQWIARNKG